MLRNFFLYTITESNRILKYLEYSQKHFLGVVFVFFFPHERKKNLSGMDNDPNLCFYSTQNTFKSKP